MLTKLRTLPTAHRLLPFVLASYCNTSTYVWTDRDSNIHEMHQGGGGEQGDALMPALFSLGLHDALDGAAGALQSNEHIMAYLDDMYSTAGPGAAY